MELVSATGRLAAYGLNLSILMIHRCLKLFILFLYIFMIMLFFFSELCSGKGEGGALGQGTLPAIRAAREKFRERSCLLSPILWTESFRAPIGPCALESCHFLVVNQAKKTCCDLFSLHLCRQWTGTDAEEGLDELGPWRKQGWGLLSRSVEANHSRSCSK